MFTLIWFIFASNLIDGSEIICDENNQCNNTILICNPSENCLINCSSNCANTIFNCPSGSYDCSLSCIGSNNCKGVTIDASTINEGNLQVHGDGQYVLHSSSIICPLSGDCTISTDGSSSFRNALVNATHTFSGNLSIELGHIASDNDNDYWIGTNSQIYCPVHGTCIVKCDDGWYACAGISVVGQITTNILSVTSYGTGALANAKIICPSSTQHCSIHAKGYYAEKIKNLKIYVNNSFDNVQLECEHHGQLCYDNNTQPMVIFKDKMCSLSSESNTEWSLIDCGTFNPTTSPTNPPSIQTIEPSVFPTVAPTQSPSTSPTNSPTRFPTSDFDHIYTVFVPIMYEIHNLTANDLLFFEDQTLMVINYFIEIVERNYLDIEYEVIYKNYMLTLLDINGFTDFSNVYFKSHETVSINSEIHSTSDIINILIKKSQSDKFQQAVTHELRRYFRNNSELIFVVKDKYDLQVKNKYTSAERTPWYSYMVVIIPICIVIIGLTLSMFVRIFNGCKHYAVDNAKWWVPLVFSLQMYDLYSDLFLTYDIFSNPLASKGNIFHNVIHWCGICNIVFIVLPYISNLLYAIKIKSQAVISNNIRAEAYFVDYISVFITCVIICGGCYPSLLLVSSRIFNLDALNCGLSKHELFLLSKIKIISTITQEDIPQLIIQMLYASLTKKMTPAIFMSFLASLTSIILAVATYFAHKSSREHSIFVNYYLEFRNDQEALLTDVQRNKILKRKGRKDELQKRIANKLGTSHENIEIGFIIIIGSGLQMQMSHCLSAKKLIVPANKNKKSGEFRMNERDYIKELYDTHQEEINHIFRDHFDFDDEDFIVQYMVDETVLTMSVSRKYSRHPGYEEVQTVECATEEKGN